MNLIFPNGAVILWMIAVTTLKKAKWMTEVISANADNNSEAIEREFEQPRRIDGP